MPSELWTPNPSLEQNSHPPQIRQHMRTLSSLIALTLLAGCVAQTNVPARVDAQALVGAWKVDLRPVPTDPAYFQAFVVTSIQGKTFTGTFYGAPVEQARINTDWGAVRIAFVTADQSGPYNHSATLIENRLEGLTNATGRNFLSYWSATKL
jgi:hypothetical protein